MYRICVLIIAAVVMVLSGYGFEPVPKDSTKALKVVKNKDKIRTGMVFINGHFIKPPYVVERYGTVIRINKQQVTEEVVPWAEFLRTQKGFKVLKEDVPVASTNEVAAVETPAVPETPPPPPGPIASASTDDDEDDSLDDLFDDVPATKKKGKKDKKPEARKPLVLSKPKPPKPAGPKITGYEIEGEFIPNDRTKAMVAKINSVRSDIDAYLRGGGFIFFGDGYSRVQGDARSAEEMLSKLPEMMQRADTVVTLRMGLRGARMDYVHEAISQGLFDNRVDYRILQEHREKVKRDKELQTLLNTTSGGNAL